MAASDLPEAAVGDRVVVKGQDVGDERVGTIAEISERDGEQFFRLALE